MAKAAPRYAKALHEALSATGAIESALPALRALAALPADLVVRLADPTLPVASRAAALREALGRPGAETPLGRFVDLLAARRRLGLVDAICREVVALHEARSGVVRGTVASRQPLEGSQLQALSASLSRDGAKVELENRLDASILGGFRVRIGDTVLDATANLQLNQARRALLSAQGHA